MEIDVANMFTGSLESGVHAIGGTTDLEDLFSAAGAAEWKVFYLNGKQLTNKEDYFTAWANIAKFPDHFGFNWDALEDCLADLSWHKANGFLIVLEHSKLFRDANPDAAEKASDILESVAKKWEQAGTPFVVLLMN